jgi:hypothetical protein
VDLLLFQERLQIRKFEDQKQVFDLIRRRWLVLQPEEMVRQLVLHYLIEARGYNAKRIAVEKGLRVNGRMKRFDILVFDAQAQPFLLVECKAPDVALDEATLQQMATYNLALRVPYLMMCNGPQSFIYAVDLENGEIAMLDEAPIPK